MEQLLTLEEYVRQLDYIIFLKNKRTTTVEEYFYRNKPTPEKEQAYKRYLETQGRCAFQMENISLIDRINTEKNISYQNPFFITNYNIKGNYSQFWFILFDLKEYLLKKVCTKGKSELLVKNAMAIPKIIKALGCKSAIYYETNYWDDDGYPEDCLASPNFLQEGEELIHLNDIIGLESKSDILEIEMKIRQYFSLRHFEQEKIDQLMQGIIKNFFISKFIGNTDENLTNFAIIKSNNGIEAAPMYDFDFCCGNDKSGKSFLEVDGQTDLEALVKHYIEVPWFRKWLENTVLTLDVEKALQQDENTNHHFNDESIKYYVQYFNKQKNRVRRCLQQQTERE